MSSKKSDQGKPDLALLSPRAMGQIASAFEFGVKKYGRYNYLETGFEWTRLASACLRHVTAWTWGEDKDPESGLSHLAHAGATIFMLIDNVELKLGKDNRFKKD